MHQLTLELLSLLFCAPFAMLWCCPCEAGCEFFSDNFTRSDDDDPGAYTEVSGDWDISSNALVTSSSNGVLIADAEHPDGDPDIKVTVTVNIATDGDIARIILDYVDSSNYWFAEVKAGTGAYLRIYQRSGGSNTQMADVSITRATGTFSFCGSIEGTNIRAFVVGGGDSCGALGSFSSPAWGIGTGTITGTVTITDVSASVVSETCEPCQTVCGVCCAGDVAPFQMKIVVTGVANGTCVDCNGFNKTYYLDHTSTCFYEYHDTATHCFSGDHYLRLSICNFFTTSATLRLLLQRELGSDNIFQTVYTTDYDCMSWVDEVLGHVAINNVVCDWSSAVIEASSVP